MQYLYILTQKKGICNNGHRLPFQNIFFVVSGDADEGDNDDDTGDEISVNFEQSPLRADARYGISKPQASRIKYALMIIFVLDVVLKWWKFFFCGKYFVHTTAMMSELLENALGEPQTWESTISFESG